MAEKDSVEIKDELDVNDILSKLMVLHDFVENHYEYDNYVVFLPNDEKSLQSISFIVEFLNNYGLKKFSYYNNRTHYTMNFKYADIRELKNALQILIPQMKRKLSNIINTHISNAGNNEEIDIERIKYRIKKCLLWLDAVSDNIAALTYLYKFKEEDIVNEIMFLNFLKSQDIDFERGRGGFIFMDGYYASYMQFKFADVPVIKEKLNSFC